MQLLKSYKKGESIIEVHQWGDGMMITVTLPNKTTSKFFCEYSELLVEFAPAKKYIQETLATLNS